MAVAATAQTAATASQRRRLRSSATVAGLGVAVGRRPAGVAL